MFVRLKRNPYLGQPLGLEPRVGDLTGCRKIYFDESEHVTPGYRVVYQLLPDEQNPVSIDYDALGRRTRLTLPNAVSTEYQYDAASRPTALIYRTATTTLGDLTYQYDAAGNRTRVGGSFARTLLPDPVAPATYDPANRQLTFGGQTLTYDANGNLTSDGVNVYTWDARDRLVEINGASVTASFAYDALGRRRNKVVNGTSAQFLYDGLNPVQEIGTPGTATFLTGLGIDEYLTRTDALGTRSLLSDGLGSTVALTNDADAVLSEYSYDPFGTTMSSGAADANPFQYTDRENDDTGLYYYRARYYHPGLARFISEDPIGFAGGLHLYAYADNNPTTLNDPLGLTTLSVCVKGSIGFGVGGGGGTCINFGYDRKKGFSTSLTGTAGGGGFAGIGGATGVSIGMSNAPTVFDLTGGSVSLGGGGGAFLVGGANGFTSFNPQIKGGEIFGGFGLLLGTGITSPFAIEGFVNTTSTILGFGTQTGFVGPTP